MSSDNFPGPNELLDNVVSFGLESVDDYFRMSGDAGPWEVPECWPQAEIARNIRAKYELYIWLELPIAKVLEWMGQDRETPLVLEGARTGGRLDLGLFGATERPNNATFRCAIELKRYILSGSECNSDAERIRAMRERFDVHGIVGGMFVGDAAEIQARLTSSLGVSPAVVACKSSQHTHLEGHRYGFIAALV
jgi:hypothetical protein